MKAGIVIPSLGKRLDFLLESFRSVQTSSSQRVFALIVAPQEAYGAISGICSFDRFVPDPGLGLAAAINHGMRQFPSEIEYVNWLGDDDQLFPGSIDAAMALLEQDQQAPYCFGGCDYIDRNGLRLFSNRPHDWAVHLLKFGPQLIPQPGLLMRRSAFEAVGGLNEGYRWAFDLDLLIKLNELGRPKRLDKTLASFRWHADSLSVGLRKGSVREASAIRVHYLPKPLKSISMIWEPFLRFVIYVVGLLISRRFSV